MYGYTFLSFSGFLCSGLRPTSVADFDWRVQYVKQCVFLCLLNLLETKWEDNIKTAIKKYVWWCEISWTGLGNLHFNKKGWKFRFWQQRVSHTDLLQKEWFVYPQRWCFKKKKSMMADFCVQILFWLESYGCCCAGAAATYVFLDSSTYIVNT